MSAVLATVTMSPAAASGIARRHGAPGCGGSAGVRVSGAVALPRTYTAAQLASLPRTSVPGRGGQHISGAALEDVVTAAQPELPAVKNAQLRVTVTVVGDRGRAVTVALGELDPSFGAHPALLVGGRRQEVDLVVPQDRAPVRTVVGVRAVRVEVSDAQAVRAPAGGVVVEARGRAITLSAAQLAALPARTLSVTFLAGTQAQTHTERGPSLLAVLQAARVRLDPVTAVVAVGSDSYAAAVTPAEQYTGGRPLLISLTEDGAVLAQPRLVADGDVKGGRDVSDLVALVVSG